MMESVKEINQAAAKLEEDIQNLIKKSGLRFESIGVEFDEIQQLSKGYREYVNPKCEIKINFRAMGDL